LTTNHYDIFRKVGRPTSNTPLDFHADPDHNPDPGISNGIFTSVG